jgi:hypothetical protein
VANIQEQLGYFLAVVYLLPSIISIMPKKVPQRRNKLAGKGKKRASAKKKAYDTEYHRTKKRKRYRAELNAENRKRPNKKDEDKSHTKCGIINESKKTNRARNKGKKKCRGKKK